MFPIDSIDNQLNELHKKFDITEAKDIKETLSFDYDNKKFDIKDGTPYLVNDVEAVKQWIYKFINTELDTYEIYKGKKFGTTVKKLFGNKTLNNGYEEAELERQIREGFLLCPGIQSVTSFNLSKENRYLIITISVKLYSGKNITISAERTV